MALITTNDIVYNIFHVTLAQYKTGIAVENRSFEIVRVFLFGVKFDTHLGKSFKTGSVSHASHYMEYHILILL